MRSNSPSARQRGFAITVVLLVTLVALGAFVFSAVLLSLASRTSAAQERSANQAYLAADSGLATLVTRLVADGVETTSEFEVWGGFDSDLVLDASEDVRARLSIQRSVLHTDGMLYTVRSVGLAGQATRTVLQEFLLVEDESPPLSLRIPAALTSYATITSAGTPTVWGLPDDAESWIFSDRYFGDPNPSLIPRLLGEGSAGEYARIGGTEGDLYRIIDANDPPADCSSGEVRVQKVEEVEEDDAFDCMNGDEPAGLIPFAATEAKEITASTVPSKIKVTDSTFSLFDVGAEIKVGGATGEIVSQDRDKGEMVVNWSVGGAINEGDPVRASIYSGVTGGQCVLGGRADFRDGCLEGQEAQLANMIETTFGEGVTEQDLLDKAQEEHDDGINSVFGDAHAIRDVPLEGWSWLNVDSGATIRDLRGEGVLVVKNNHGSGVTLNVSNEFQGLIYVIGTITLAGNALSTGAVMVDGTAYLEEPTDEDNMVRGTTDIRYDPFALLSAIRSLSNPGDQPFEIQAVAGSSRIR